MWFTPWDSRASRRSILTNMRTQPLSTTDVATDTVVAPHVMPPSSALQQFYARYGQSDGLFYMGHASVLCVFGGYKILFDPVVLSRPYGDAWAFFPPQVRDPSVFDVDAVVVSHIHQDHYDLSFLKALQGRAKVIVIGGRPSFLQDLADNGVQNLHVIAPEVVTEIFGGVSIYGVLHETNGIDSSAIVFNERFCIYHGNDNYLQPASLAKFTQVGPRIDVACIPYAYVHWYPFLLEHDADQAVEIAQEGERLVRMYMDDCLNAIRILQPRAMIPFGANLVLNHGGIYSAINMAVKTPIEFCEYARGQAPDLAAVVQPMLAGDYCGPRDGALDIVIDQSFDGSSYRQSAEVFLASIPPTEPGAQDAAMDEQAFLRLLNQRLQAITAPQRHMVRIELQRANGPHRLEIDCAVREARWVQSYTEGIDYHHFKLDPVSSGVWLGGGRLEEVIGTRRFTLRRVPNVYSKSILRLVSTVF